MAFSGAVLLAAGIPESYQRQNLFSFSFSQAAAVSLDVYLRLHCKSLHCGKLWVLFRLDALEDDQYTLTGTRRAGFLP